MRIVSISVGARCGAQLAQKDTARQAAARSADVLPTGRSCATFCWLLTCQWLIRRLLAQMAKMALSIETGGDDIDFWLGHRGTASSRRGHGLRANFEVR